MDFYMGEVAIDVKSSKKLEKATKKAGELDQIAIVVLVCISVKLNRCCSGWWEPWVSRYIVNMFRVVFGYSLFGGRISLCLNS